MKLLVVGFLASLALAVVPDTDSVGGRVDITATVASSLASDGGQISHRSRYLRLWNLNLNPRPIGHAFVSCSLVGLERDFSHQVWSCQANYRMPLGAITAQGLVHSFDRYTLSVTGGSGLYTGQGGVAHSRRLGPGTFHVLMRLEP